MASVRAKTNIHDKRRCIVGIAGERSILDSLRYSLYPKLPRELLMMHQGCSRLPSRFWTDRLQAVQAPGGCAAFRPQLSTSGLVKSSFRSLMRKDILIEDGTKEESVSMMFLGVIRERWSEECSKPSLGSIVDDRR